MKINCLEPLSFEKILKANCHILKNNKQYPCKIYELEQTKDEDYFDLKKDEKWQDGIFWNDFKDSFYDIISLSDKSYVMEDDKKDCLGFVNINKTKDKIYLYLFEKMPYTKELGYKYIGETFLSFLAGLSKKNNFKSINIPVWERSAETFYTDKCHFDYDIFENELILKKDNFNKLIEQNTNHTKRNIDYTF